MPTELPKAYDPKAAQDRWLAAWEAEKCFRADPAKPGEPYTIVIPPPNVTGALHMGHALNNTLQDVLVRWRRMQGRNALWVPGTDHAGIATQAVVERLLTAEDKNFKRREYGREKLVAKIWEWKDKYEARILGQLKQMGASCDFSRTRFTLDDTCARAVRETFFRMFSKRYIYRGKRLVNWDTQLQTSVADDETYTETTKGGFWTFKYQVLGEPGASATGGTTFIQFSTTRPETMLGDSALCVHPDDERYKALVGKKVLQPHTGREIPIIADGELADPELGTGCVKVTPAHDPNDYACWERQTRAGKPIDIINILNPDGTIAAGFGEYSGLDRAKAHEAVAAKMEELGLFVDKAERDIPLPFSDRSKTPIEPFLSDQWFVRMGDAPASRERERPEERPGLARLAMDAVTSGRVKFFPERYAKTYLDWLGEKRDWCISRQLWWGHRIPVWTVFVNREGITTGDIKAESKIRVENARLALMDFLKHCGFTTDMFSIAETTDYTLHVCTADLELGRTLEQLGQMIRNLRLRHLEEAQKEGPAVLPERATGNFPAAILAMLDNTQESPISQDPDVLDTWFSSALWPHSTLGWPEQTPELAKYYPTSTLCTSRDIITLWVARMVLTGLTNVGEVPFHHVYIHPKIMDGFGEGMSKSKGNGADPLDIIDLYGTDAMRYGVTALATETQDSRMPIANVCPHCGTLIPQKKEHQAGRTKKIVCPGDKAAGVVCGKAFRPSGPWTDEDPELPTAKAASDRFELGRNFANKLWNATRFILMNLEGYTAAPLDLKTLPVEDRWIISKLATTATAVTAALEAYRFADAAKTLYDFAWGDFCDWYLEMSKGRLKDDAGRATVQRVLAGVLDGIVRLIHPIMPFLSESLWAAVNEACPERGLPTTTTNSGFACLAAWPTYPAELTDTGTESAIARLQSLVSGLREIRNRYMIEKTPLTVVVRCGPAVKAEIDALAAFVKLLAGVGTLTVAADAAKPKPAGSLIKPDFEAYVALEGLIDPAVEAKRLEKQIADREKQLAGVSAKLGNASFVANAPPEIIEQQKATMADLTQQVATLKENLAELK